MLTASHVRLSVVALSAFLCSSDSLSFVSLNAAVSIDLCEDLLGPTGACNIACKDGVRRVILLNAKHCRFPLLADHWIQLGYS